MNAIPTVSQAPINIDPASTSGTASADSAARSAGGQDFAAALSNAGSKSTRKPAANKAQDGASTGGQLPAPGNVSPPPATPAAAAVAAATAAGAGGAMNGTANGTKNGSTSGAASGASGAAPGTAAIPGAQAKAGGPNSPGAPLAAQDAGAVLTAPAGAGSAGTAPGGTTPDGTATAPGAAFGQVLGTLAADPAVLTGAAVSTAGNAAKDARTAGAVDSAESLLAPKGSDAAGGAPASVRGSAAADSVDRPLVGATALAAANAATNAATSAASTAGSDATAQTATAAAMAAAATGVADSGDAGSTDGADSSSADDLAAAAAGGAAQVAGGANSAPGLAPAVSALRAAAAAVATVAASAEAAAKLASAVSDKHAPGGTGASPLSPASGDAAAGAASLSVNANSAADTAPTPTLKVAAGVDTPEFGQGLADRVSWMVDNSLNGAKLQVNPPQLGPIEVRISVQGDHAQVWLASHSAVTRDALESSSPKLREMLGAQGFAQVSVDISQRSFQERSTQAQPYDWSPSADRNASATAGSSAAAATPRTPSGAVDAYA